MHAFRTRNLNVARTRATCAAAVFAALGALASAGPVAASPRAEVLFVLSEEGGVYQELYEATRRHLNGTTPGITLKTTGVGALKDGAALGQARLIVGVGTRATQRLLELDAPAPVLAAMVPRASFEELRKHAAPRNLARLSAVYLDQPGARQLTLLRLILPAKHRIGVLLGSVSAIQRGELEEAAAALNLSLQFNHIAPGDNLVQELGGVLQRSDALLLVPDPLVTNRAMAQSLLLTTYRHNVPVIAFSHSYVEAGALAAVYSTPSQIGEHVGDVVRAMAGAGNWKLPRPQAPAHFSVAVNAHVARSLGLDVPAAAVLEQRLRLAPGRGP